MKKIAQALVLFAVATGPSQAHAIQVYAHRGARSFNPENTMPAYKSTLRIGTDWVDMDVVLTKDGQVLITHDPLLNPDIVRGADGNFIAKKKEQLQAYS